MTPRWKGKVKGNRIQWERPVDFLKYLSGLDGKTVEIIVKPWRDKRSDRQNSYYWGVVVPIVADYMGYMSYESERAHDALRGLFLAVERKGIVTMRSTTDLNTKEFENYMSEIRQYMSIEHNVYIPEPNEVER